jgi:hypothetical protein
VATEKTFESELPWLLDELCVELGFCLPAAECESLMNSPPRDVDAFADAVLAAEGIDPSLNKQLRRAVRSKIERRVGHLMASPPPGERSAP